MKFGELDALEDALLAWRTHLYRRYVLRLPEINNLVQRHERILLEAS